MMFSDEDKVFIKVLRQERVIERNSMSKSLQTKLVSVVHEDVADDD